MQKTLTKEQLAAKLNGRRYRDEITPEEERLAKENKLLVIFGASDDLIELRGAINEELGFESVIRLGEHGVPKNKCDDEDCPYYTAQLKRDIKRGIVKEIGVCWGGEGMDSLAYQLLGEPTWCFDCEKLNNKFSTFDIFDEYEGDREYFCRGVVIDISDFWPPKTYEQMVM